MWLVVGSPLSWQDPSISIMSIDEIGNLTSPLDVGLEMGGYRAPYCMRWRPNGSVVALIIKEFGVPQTAPLVPSLAIIRPGPGESPVVIQRQVDSCVSWSPDGKYIAFENEGIFYIDYKSGLVTNVTSTDGYYPVWSPDGNNIAFATRPGISVVDVDTKEETQIYSGGVQGLLWGR